MDIENVGCYECMVDNNSRSKYRIVICNGWPQLTLDLQVVIGTAYGAWCELDKSSTVIWSKSVSKHQLSSSAVSSCIILQLPLVHLFVPCFVPILLQSVIFNQDWDPPFGLNFHFCGSIFENFPSGLLHMLTSTNWMYMGHSFHT